MKAASPVPASTHKVLPKHLFQMVNFAASQGTAGQEKHQDPEYQPDTGQNRLYRQEEECMLGQNTG